MLLFVVSQFLGHAHLKFFPTILVTGFPGGGGFGEGNFGGFGDFGGGGGGGFSGTYAVSLQSALLLVSYHFCCT